MLSPIILELEFLVNKTMGTAACRSPSNGHRFNPSYLTKTARESKESEVGCRYSCLLQLPYFNPIKMTVINPMHNLNLGTAKTVWSLYQKLDVITDSDLLIISSWLTSLHIPSNVNFSSLPKIGSSKFTA